MRIFNPIGTVIPPEVIDGVQNVLTKSGTTSTSSTSLVELRRVELVPNLFSDDNDRIEIDAIFSFLNTTSNKRVVVELQRSIGGNATLFDGTLALAANSNGVLKLISTVQGLQIKSEVNLIVADTSSIALNLSANRLASTIVSFNPAILNFISIQALVVNAADTVILEWLGGSFR